MSTNVQSITQINPTLTALSKTNSQFPYILYEGPNCTGRQYPAVNATPQWNQDITNATVGFDTVRSIYVPPHALLELWSPGWSAGKSDGYFVVYGPNTISNTGSFLANWYHSDLTPCYGATYGSDGASRDISCGKRVGTNDGWVLPGAATATIGRFRPGWVMSWFELTAGFASNGQQIVQGPVTYTLDNDKLMNDLCPNPRYPCRCTDVANAILAEHADAASKSYVNLLQNGCNPSTQYVPTYGNVADGTVAECLQQINAQLNACTFKTISQGGPQLYICGGRVYENAVDPPENCGSALAKTAEMAPPSQTTPDYVYGVMAALVALGLLLVFAKVMMNGKSSKSADSIYRKKMASKFSG